MTLVRELPALWSMVPLKALSACRITNGLGEATQEGEDGWPRYVRTTDIASPRRLRDDLRAAVPPEIAHKAMLQAGDLLLCSAGSLDSFVMFDGSEPACFAGYLTRFRPDPHRCEPRYVAYCAEDVWFREQVELGKVRSTIDNYSASKYAATRIPVPPTVENQRAIADFLDSASARLQETRTAETRLHEAALVSFRDWSASTFLRGDGGTDRLKYLVDSPVGGTWGSEPGADAVDVVCARVADFDREALTVREPPTIRSVPDRDAGRLALRDGDLLLEKSGGGPKSPVGFVVRYSETLDRTAVSSNFIARLRPRYEEDSLYLVHLFAALYGTRRNEAFVKQNTGIQNLDVDAYLSLHVPTRPLTEQRLLAREAQARLDAALTLRAKAEALRVALDECRYSLIHEAVTGKIGRS